MIISQIILIVKFDVTSILKNSKNFIAKIITSGFKRKKNINIYVNVRYKKIRNIVKI